MALRESPNAHRRRFSKDELAEVTAIIMPRILAEAARNAEIERREVDEDVLGYVWWRYWKRSEVVMGLYPPE